MSVRPGSSASRSRASGEYRELRLPNSRAVKALIYFCGRDPRKAKSVRRYYDEDFDARSTGSGGSMFSWSSGTSGVCLVETTNPYWYWDEAGPDSASYSSSSTTSRKRKSSSRKGRSSRSSHHRTSPAPPPTGSSWGPRHATVEDDDDDGDYDDSSSDGSDDYGDHHHPAAAPFHPHPGMMPPPPPPVGGPAYHQPVYGGMPYPAQHATPHPPAGFHMPPPPPQMAGGMPPPPPPGGHFVTGRDGIQVFVDG